MIQEMDDFRVENFNAKVIVIKSRTTSVTPFSSSMNIS